MKVVVTGSLGNIGKPLTEKLLKNGHSVKVISSSSEREIEIKKIGAKAAIGSIMDINFLINTFQGAEVVYLMGIWESVGNIFDKNVDFETGFNELANNYKKAIEQTGIKKVIYLSSIGAHTNKGIGVLEYHYNVEQILNKLSDDISVKFMRPVGFYTNLFRSIPNIKAKDAIIQNFGSETKEPWVSPLDIAHTIAEEIELPFNGRKVRYIASEEISSKMIVKILGEEIGNLNLKWITISDEDLLSGMLSHGMNEKMAKGFIEMQASQRSGAIYEDYNRNKPILGNVKFEQFAKEFSKIYNQ